MAVEIGDIVIHDNLHTEFKQPLLNSMLLQGVYGPRGGSFGWSD